MNRIALAACLAGLCLAAFCLSNLRQNHESALQHNRNPFAIERSAYGRLIARLSQDTINRVWHVGVEQVHDPNHAQKTRRPVRSISGPAGLVAEGRDYLSAMKQFHYRRTNPYGISDAHHRQISKDLEMMFLRSYRMDPTDYGVYNGYYLFLTMHHLGMTPESREHAKTISRHTLALAMNEDTDPAAWNTASMALLNLFFLDLEDWKIAGMDPDPDKVREYRDQMAFTISNHEVLKEKAIAANRWEKISRVRREDMRQRNQFANRTFEQFDAILARVEPEQEPGSGKATNDQADLPGMAEKTDPEP